MFQLVPLPCLQSIHPTRKAIGLNQISNQEKSKRWSSGLRHGFSKLLSSGACIHNHATRQRAPKARTDLNPKPLTLKHALTCARASGVLSTARRRLRERERQRMLGVAPLLPDCIVKSASKSPYRFAVGGRSLGFWFFGFRVGVDEGIQACDCM